VSTVNLLNTHIVSHVIRGDEPQVRERLQRLRVGTVAISAVTEGELRYGLARRGHPAGLTQRVEAFLVRVDILPWDTAVAQAYGKLRAACEAVGVTLASLDKAGQSAFRLVAIKAFASASKPG
jgi:tRNA(fMet)-specific endonuclease VapC